MANRFLQPEDMEKFRKQLISEEKSEATIRKYMRDAIAFLCFARDTAVTKELLVDYKSELLRRGCAIRSVNTVVTSLNRLFASLGWQECRIKNLKMQQKVYSSPEKELTKAEYLRLIQTARRMGNERLELLLQAICGTGIRVSELQFITVEAAKRGEAVISLKGKTRTMLIIQSLQKKLLRYAAKHKIVSGAIFITRNGKNMNRTNIWREMKRLCVQAGVEPQKVFPHNLRHLFARCFYTQEKDIAKLADILGHSSINTTRIYLMTTGAEHCQKMERLHLIL